MGPPIYSFGARCGSAKRRVLQAHSDKHLELIKSGGEQRQGSLSDGAYHVRPGSLGHETAGRIPRNILSFGHRCSAPTAYKKAARALGLPAHGAPMPMKLASFLIEFLSQPGDLVANPFGGSFTTAHTAERLGRRWLSTECMLEYVLGGARFEQVLGYQLHLQPGVLASNQESFELALAD